MDPGANRVPVRRRRIGVLSATDIDPGPADRTPTLQLTGGYPRRSKRRCRGAPQWA
ncbi:hypothetical protein I553_0600 [Mycobacterium xenopi 4042]|uniref:Uncharacterized protein n=1 Tax=Mycobacterium xenopi 4042 TaxID=1299334 RepID=X7YKV3_MYCXE|nr:hypothetical protein I553_0600 [Mycobacterium xenopi 4042]